MLRFSISYLHIHHIYGKIKIRSHDTVILQHLFFLFIYFIEKDKSYKTILLKMISHVLWELISFP